MQRGRPSHRPPVTFTRSVLDQFGDGQGRLSLVDKIFHHVVSAIQAGTMAPGQRIHSVRQLSDQCEVSRDTVARAYDKLIAHGHLESRPGSGFFVKSSQQPKPSSVDRCSTTLLPEWWRFRLVQPTANLTSTSGLGLLPPDWLDELGLGKAMRAVARASVRHLSSYSEPLGYLPMRQQLQAKLRELHIDAPVQRIMITAGATHALQLIVTSMLREPGEHVLFDDPGSFLLRDRLLASGLNILPVPRKPDGPDLEVLRDHCIAHRPRFFFCSSVLHNPTSGHVSPHQACQILRLADEFNFTIVEDDVYGDFMPIGKSASVTRLASLDQLERVIYVGSFSKTVAPGLRIGYVCASQKVMDWLMIYRTVNEICGNSTNERVMYQLLSNGAYRHHCAQLRGRLDECRQPVIERLAKSGCSIDLQPAEGMYVWAALPDGAAALPLADKLLKSGHLVAPGPLFSSDPAHASRMRFNISRTMNIELFTELDRHLISRSCGAQDQGRLQGPGPEKWQAASWNMLTHL